MDYNGLTVLANTAADSAAIGTGTFLLGDNRETVNYASGTEGYNRYGATGPKVYLVRRLADGNCWMVQNLDLNLKAFAGTNNLTSQNTDLNTKTSWNPSASLINNQWNTSADSETTITGGYANHLGIANILEPGPGYDNPNVGVLSISNYQFQDHLDYGPNLYWGSRYGANTTIDNTGTPNNNGLVIASETSSTRYPRSYNYDLAYLGGNQTVRNPDECSKGTVSACAMTVPTSATPSVDLVRQTSDGLLQDSSYRPDYVSNNADSAYTMRGSMYFGDAYNRHAATAESYTPGNTSDPQDSICPFGWEMPKRASFANLIINSYSLTKNFGSGNHDAVTKVIALPISFTYSGIYQALVGSSRVAAGYHTYLWESSVTNYGELFYFVVHDTGNLQNADSLNYRYDGKSIRCVQKGSVREPVVATCSEGSICYNGNGADSGSMNDDTVNSNSTMLTAPTYTRDGYAFAGWSTSSTGYGTTYGPNETVDTTTIYNDGGDPVGSLQLYARWIKSSGTMQEFTAAQCTAMNEHEVIALTDNRDGNTYSVAKLKDGNCWMTSNLALNLADFAGENPAKGYLTTENTDLSASRTDLIEVASTGGGNPSIMRWDPSKSMFSYAETVYEANPSKFASLLADGETGVTENNYFKIASLDLYDAAQQKQFGYDSSSDDSNINRVRYFSDGSVVFWGEDRKRNNQVPRAEQVLNENKNLGYYYNWYSAVAESGTFDTENSDRVPDSICPSGWALPVHNSLISQYPRTASVKYPFSNILVGVRSKNGGSSWWNVDTDYWTPVVRIDNSWQAHTILYTANNNADANTLQLYQYGKQWGVSVRCRVKPS